MRFWLELIRMQNNCKLQKEFFKFLAFYRFPLLFRLYPRCIVLYCINIVQSSMNTWLLYICMYVCIDDKEKSTIGVVITLLIFADWEGVFSATNVSDQWDAFLTEFLPIFDDHPPVNNLTIRNPTAPPVTTATLKIMDQLFGNRELEMEMCCTWHMHMCHVHTVGSRYSAMWHMLPFNASKCTTLHVGGPSPETNYTLNGVQPAD